MAELTSLPSDINNALQQANELCKTIRDVRDCGSSLAITLSGSWVPAANELPERLKQAEAAITPLLIEFKQAAKETTSFLHIVEPTAFAVVLQLGSQTVLLVDYAIAKRETENSTFTPDDMRLGPKTVNRADMKESYSLKGTVTFNDRDYMCRAMSAPPPTC